MIYKVEIRIDKPGEFNPVLIDTWLIEANSGMEAILRTKHVMSLSGYENSPEDLIYTTDL